jgi:hypothetical protein
VKKIKYFQNKFSKEDEYTILDILNFKKNERQTVERHHRSRGMQWFEAVRKK